MNVIEIGHTVQDVLVDLPAFTLLGYKRLSQCRIGLHMQEHVGQVVKMFY